MKKRTSMLAAACALALAHAGAYAQMPPTNPTMPEQPHDMRCWPMTGNVDNDYALALHHHRAMQAEMARAYLARNPTDPTLRAIAQAQVDAYAAENTRLETWLTGRQVDWGWPPVAPNWRWVGLDVNHDGMLSSSELVATHPLHPHFTAIDVNRDGFISNSEIVAFHQSVPFGWRAIDANNDGIVQRGELLVGHPLHDVFDTIDANDDGFASSEEIETYHRQMANSPQGAHPAHLHHPRIGWPCDTPVGDTHVGDVHDKSPPPAFRTQDANGDGFLTRDELSSGEMLLGHFTQADTNNDGRLSAGEVDAHRAAMAEMGKD
jgi:hypothetical protein